MSHLAHNAAHSAVVQMGGVKISMSHVLFQIYYFGQQWRLIQMHFLTL